MHGNIAIVGMLVMREMQYRESRNTEHVWGCILVQFTIVMYCRLVNYFLMEVLFEASSFAFLG